MHWVEQFSPRERAAMTDILSHTEHTKVGLGAAIVRISMLFNKHPLTEVEGILRELESNTFLIAQPMTARMTGDYISILPHTKNKGVTYSFYVDITEGGLTAARAKLADLQITRAENYVHLMKTGILSPKPGTELARSFHFHNN